MQEELKQYLTFSTLPIQNSTPKYGPDLDPEPPHMTASMTTPRLFRPSMALHLTSGFVKSPRSGSSAALRSSDWASTEDAQNICSVTGPRSVQYDPGLLTFLAFLACFFTVEQEGCYICNADNCLRALRATTRNLATASAFCTNYINYTPGTVTITASTSTTTTPAQVTVTISDVSTSTVITDSTLSITPIATVMVALNYAIQKRKRDVAATLPSYFMPGCNPTGTTSAAARASSACSCFLTTATTTTTSVSTVTAAALMTQEHSILTQSRTPQQSSLPHLPSSSTPSTVTVDAPAPTISTCVSRFFYNYASIADGPYNSAKGTFPAAGIASKIDCCNACFLGQSCYKYQFSDPALSPPGTDSCVLYQFLSAPSPSVSASLGAEDTGSSMEFGTCIDQGQKKRWRELCDAYGV
ncbi:hypothetical protein MMC30_000684 [Trapelia coarctata]|nr:hypothetical protein [Trapelia coarctata]